VNRLVAIDPGKDRIGYSLWDEGVLVEAAWLAFDDLPAIVGVERVVMERPRARHPNETPGGVCGYQAIVDIGISGALWAGKLGGAFETVFPDEWKGGTSKAKTKVYVIEQRAKAILKPDERVRVELPSAASKQHNVWDAVGIGLYALGRAGRGLERR